MTQKEVESAYKNLSSKQATVISLINGKKANITVVNNATGSGYSGDVENLVNSFFDLSVTDQSTTIYNVNCSGKARMGIANCLDG